MDKETYIASFDKIVKVINSCNTHKQLTSAGKMIIYFENIKGIFFKDHVRLCFKLQHIFKQKDKLIFKQQYLYK